jgi:hypothetical protein
MIGDANERKRWRKTGIGCVGVIAHICGAFQGSKSRVFTSVVGM